MAPPADVESRSRSPTRSGDEEQTRRDTDGNNDEAPQRKRRYSSSRSRSRSRSHLDSRSRSASRTRQPLRSSSIRSSSTTSSCRRRTPSSTPSSKTSPNRRKHTSTRPNFHRQFSLHGHTRAVSQVRISPDGRWIASASADGTARIWDALTGAHMDTLVGHMAGVSCLAWSPDSRTLATGSDDKAIRLWDRVSGEPAHESGGGLFGGGRGASVRGSRRPLLGHHNYVYCVAFSPKGNVLASGSYDEAVFLWDVRAGRLMRSLPAHSDPVSGIDFCRDGTLVVSCSTDGLIRIWDTTTGQCLRTLLLLNEDNPAVSHVTFSPNGRFVLAFNLDSCVRLWDYIPHPSTVAKTYSGHRNSKFSVGGCFGSHAGAPFVAAASEDGDVVLWDVVSKDVVQRLRSVHDGVCFWVDVCGDTMVSCGKDGKIVVFRKEGDKAANGIGEGEGAGDGQNGAVDEDDVIMQEYVVPAGENGRKEIEPSPMAEDTEMS